ncbi:uncharacterized protein [Ptychodera flava]|uniref:uncharacterized protein isoform X2 n=1 Tax=Ptychodera flava TaxID=63121 RepID=UPI00396A818E
MVALKFTLVRVLNLLALLTLALLLRDVFKIGTVKSRSSEDSGDETEKAVDVVTKERFMTVAKTVSTIHHEVSLENDKRNREKLYREQLHAIFDRFPWFDRKQFSPNYFIVGVSGNSVEAAVKPRIKDQTYMFVHNQKSGGTTLKDCIDRITRQKQMARYVGVWDEYEVAKVIHDVNHKHAKSKFYASEYTFGLCDEFNRQNCSYFTLIRDPYERLISCHEFCKRALTDPLCAASDARNLTLKEWALHQGSYFFRQLQFKPTYACSDKIMRDKISPKINKAKYLGRNATRPPCWYRHKLLLDDALNDMEKEVLLNYFLDNLKNWFTVIGITEEYRTTLGLLQQAYNLPFRDLCMNLISMKGLYKVDGKPATPQSKQELIQKLKAELQADPEINRTLYYDVKIYEKAREIFEEEKKQYFSMLGLGNQ